MGVLNNPKWERFAQERAKGKSADQAYKDAGYMANRKNASRLKTNDDIKRRIEEILERFAIRTEITIEKLTEMHLEDHEGAVRVAQYSAAKGALDSIAKLHGLLIDKQEIKGDIQITKIERVIVYPQDSNSRD